MERAMLRGSCLCGGIVFEIAGPVPGIGQCHCSLCRKVSGVGSTATVAVAADQLKWISGENLVQAFERPSGYGSSFCRICGSPAPDPNRSRTRYGIPVGVLDDDPGVTVVEHIYVGSKASWDVIADGAPQYEDIGPPARPG
jgi:hypothetical protein